DMPGISEGIITHKLSLFPNVNPVSQRKRRLCEERRKVVDEEVRKLKEAGFITEIEYPTWLANVVMVKKESGKWRMCVDFTDLNLACPKDPYPLPSIDRLIDGASGCETLSFMDAYSGYNQIKMNPTDP
ncbi:gag-pol polyprotein, partial [Trifolium medium]|nr:gag-pol polyprotein [Trifolium medium]